MKKYNSIIQIFYCVIAASISMLVGCVSYQEGGLTMDERVAILEERLAESEAIRKTLQTRIEKISASQAEENQEFKSKSAESNVQYNKLRDDLQVLRGRIDETEYFLKRKLESFNSLDKKYQQLIEKIYERTNANKDHIINLEQYLNFETTDDYLKTKTGATTQPLKEGDKGIKKELTEEELYRLAKQGFDNGRFESARENFQKFIKRYPKSSNADNAQFWIGEIYYREKWYEKAILEYQKVIEQFSKGNKVKASLLKQGFSFYNLKDKPNARLILKELINKYPKSNEAAIARKKLKGF